MKRLFSFFVYHPLLVNLLLLLIIVAGVTALRSNSIQTSPKMEFGFFSITTTRAGSSAEKMELSVTVPLEEELLKVDNVRRIISNSMESLSIIQVNADSSADSQQLALIEADLQKAIDRARARLPADLLEQPLLRAITSSETPLLQLAVTGRSSEQTLRLVARRLQSELREVKGVTSVQRQGFRDREVRVLLKPDMMSRLGISPTEVADAIRRRNVSETGGSLESFVGEQDIVAVGEFTDPKEVDSVIVRSHDPGDHLKLRDLATVVLDYEDWQERYSIGGEMAILLEVRREEGVNDLELVDELRQIIGNTEAGLPPGVDVLILDDLSDITTTILVSLLHNAAIGGVLVTLLLLFFLPWRAAFWVVAGIPLAILIALVLQYVLGMGFTALSMVAIILMTGLIVDDAIVCSERIYRFHEQGLDPRGSAIAGVDSVARPVVTAALTTIIAMTPLLLVEGVESKLLWVIPATVILLVIGSLLECLFLLPSHLAQSLRHSDSTARKAQWFDAVEKTYRSILRSYLRRPLLSTVLMLALFGCGLPIVAMSNNFEPYGDVDTNTIVISAALPPDSSLASTLAAMEQVEETVRQSEWGHYIDTVYTVAGNRDRPNMDYLIEGRRNNWGKVAIQLESFNERTTTAMDIRQGFTEALTELNPQFNSLRVTAVVDYPPLSAPVELQLIMDGDERDIIADEVLEFLRLHPAVTEVWSNSSSGRSLIDLQLRHEKLADFGLTVSDVTRALRVAYDGIVVDELQTREERIRYRLQLQGRYRENPLALLSLDIVKANGERVPIRNIADFRTRQGRFSIFHYAGLRSETVFADIDREMTTASAINEELRRFLDERGYQRRHPDLRFHFGGELLAQAETGENLSKGLALVLVSIYCLLVILFYSLTLPLAALMVIPLSFLAVLVVFVIQDLTLGTAAMVGFLGLVGVLVNDSLVMIDQICKLHAQRNSGRPWIALDDIIDGAVLRLRPLCVVAITTMAGLGPAAYGVAGMHPTTQGMLIVMFWGVTVGSLVTLFSLPLYLTIDSHCKRLLARRRPAN